VVESRDDALATEPKRRAVSLEALRVTLGRAPVWCIAWAFELLLALAPAIAWGAWMSSTTAHRYAPRSLLGELDTVFRFDQRRALGLVDESNARTGAVLALIAMLAGCFTAGGWLQVFLERTEGHSLRRFFWGGARYFWRFVRVLVLTILSLALLDYLVYGAPWNVAVLHWMCHVPAADYEKLETLTSERSVFAIHFAQSSVYALLFTLVLVWGDYTRTRLALHDTMSAVWAGLCTWFTLVRHPLKTLAPMLWLGAIELAIVAVAGAFSHRIDADLGAHASLLGAVFLLVIGALALLWRVILRGARYHAAVQVSREVVSPLARPDPWKESFGPPSGPRYPLGGDEYGMSL
jgi:hypothetical protein